MAFDGIVTKAIAGELQTLAGARIDKIFQPNKNTVLLGFYLDGKNFLLNLCVDVANYRIHLTTHPKSNPKVAPHFCMVLRKHLIRVTFKKCNYQQPRKISYPWFWRLWRSRWCCFKKTSCRINGKTL